ncbi:pilus assembly protein TadG-related protein [Rhodopirellula halodulae]|uniref:pilus assembly protein TadG-related protein n=1 Tax=Rhodopirellula halodulae TaxID=2894198 RepID=UPI001E3C8423|nr:Tad domain-containing protein [Rhodopirellula sp. JC737]MCC9655010.1 Tad domain-containing protein [Rhodopirellula sp. JC737]
MNRILNCNPPNKTRGKSAERDGVVLVLMAIVFFVLIGIAALSIDLGMARLTQTHMQSVADAAAIEGGWNLAMQRTELDVREFVVQRADLASDSWGPKRIELDEGTIVAVAGQTIRCDTLGDPVEPTLEINASNELAGDIVLGNYDREVVPDELPGQPAGYDRSLTFLPDTDQPNSILVRLRRTGEDDLAGGTSAERLVGLWTRGSLLNLESKARGISVRGESIVQLMPVVAVGGASSELVPSALSVALPRSEMEAETYQRTSLRRIDEASLTVGTPVSSVDAATDFAGVGYLPIFDVLPTGNSVVIGFVLAEVTAGAVVPRTMEELGFEFPNATANPTCVSVLNDEVLMANRSLAGTDAAHAPVLVRARQIQGTNP